MMLLKFLLKWLFWSPIWIKLLYLTANVSDIIGNRIIAMPFTLMIIND